MRLRLAGSLLSGSLLSLGWVALAAGLGFGQAVTAPAQVPSAEFQKTVQAAFGQRAYQAQGPAESRWLDGGERYTVLEPSATDPKQIDLVAYDTASGKREVLIGAKLLVPSGAAEELSVDDYQWSADKKHLLVMTAAQRVWRQYTRGDFWVLDLPATPGGAGKLTKLGGSAPASSLMFAKLAPDSKSVAYVSRNNVYVQSLGDLAIKQLTTDGSADVINGTSDWVNEEELDIRDGFRWSPDSRRIAYWQFDQSGVGDYTLINDTKAEYPATFVYKYPQPGTTNSAVRVGVVAAAGGATTWVKVPGDLRQHYIARMEWVGDADELTLEVLNRPQNQAQVYVAKAATGDVRVLFEDHDAAWLEVVDQLRWLQGKDGKARELVWLSDRDGWRHAYLIDRGTGKTRLVTNFAADVIDEVLVDEAGGYFYFTASPGDPIRVYLYRSRLDGTGVPERVTPATETGTHGYDVSPNGKWAIHSFSAAGVPPSYELVALPSHAVTRGLVKNDELAAKLSALLATPVDYFQTPIGEGVKLASFMIKPPNFNPAKHYPVLVYIYGEPAGQTVKDVWGGSEEVYLRAIAREGYVVVSFDNAGTPGPLGRAWRKSGYGAIGVLSSAQQAAAIRELGREHPYIDMSRLAIWGWSGGGTNTLNMMFRFPGLFAAGISVAPVPDQAHYDTIYQERYMGLPQENVQGYHDGSAINFAGGLQGHLLVVHGSGDDNVHFQGTELLVNKLIELGKPFEFMDYPNRTHGIYEGKGTSVHVYSLIGRYLEEHVAPGPR